MAKFSYVALERNGVRTTGEIEGADKRAAQKILESRGLIPVKIEENFSAANKKGGTVWWKLAGSDQKMSPREIMLFTEELSDLLAAGMTLANALNCLANRGASAESRICADLRDRVIQGEAFSAAVRAHPEIFPPLYGNMIQAGEASGALSEVLIRLVEHYERTLSMREKIVQALTYPIIVLIMGVGVVIFAMLKIIPQFMTVFESTNISLPKTTQMLIGCSEFMQKYFLFIVIGVALFCVGLKRWLATDSGRRCFDSFKLRAPLVKGVVANGIYANFARTLQTLLSNGVTVLSALKITQETVGNVIIANEIAHARERVTDGTSISGPLAQGGIFPRVMTDMLQIGEQTGDMPSALDHIGRRFESELDRNIKVFTAAIEPIMIVLVAGLVGFVAISILSAVFRVTSGIGGA